MHLGEEEKHLAGEAAFEKQVRMEWSRAPREKPPCPSIRRPGETSYFPAYPGLDAIFDEFVGGVRPEVYQPPVAGFADFGFAAKIVEFEESVERRQRSVSWPCKPPHLSDALKL